jgi:hypothetical protein
MTATTTFTPQQVLNQARTRHPSFTDLLLDDPQILVDLNTAISEVILDVSRIDDTVLAQACATVAVTSAADGNVVDLNPTDGEVLRFVDADVVRGATSSVTARLALVDWRQRTTAKAQFADDLRAVGSLLRSTTNGRWQLMCIGNWGTQYVNGTSITAPVTALIIYGVIKPVPVTSGAIGTYLTLPSSLFRPLVEKIAMIFGRRANLDQNWMAQQTSAYADAIRSLGAQFANFDTPSMIAAPPPGVAPAAPPPPAGVGAGPTG